MTSRRDYYEILGVSRDADKDIINKAYRKLALKHHPDRNKDNPKEAEQKFKEVTEAYQVLIDPEQRHAYDQFGHAGVKGAAAGAQGFGGFGGFGNMGDIFSEVFGDIFGGGTEGRRSRAHRGSDLKIDIEIDFLDAVFGAEKIITIPKQHPCEMCKGTGADPKLGTTTCRRCQGSGQINTRQGFFNISRTCDTCQGEGMVIEKICGHCRGLGVTDIKSKLEIKIPPGIHSGQKLKMSHEGAVGSQGGPPGDLYIEVHVGEHELFKREEDDIYLEVPITILQATQGSEIEIPTLHGNVKMTVPPGTQSGNQFKLKGKGVPHISSRHFGDQIVKTIVETPALLDKEQTQLLKKFMDSVSRKNHPLAEKFLKKVTSCVKK